jgi:hypothetical protein
VLSPWVPLKVFKSKFQVFAMFPAGSVNTDEDDLLPQMT